MSSSSSDGVDEAFEEFFDEEFDNIVDSLLVQANKPKRRAYIESTIARSSILFMALPKKY